jgi:nucleoside-diphosphate-sugar epimerase
VNRVSPTIVVVGATGDVGRHAVAVLHARGYRVRALVRPRECAEAPGAFGAPSLQWLVAEGEVVDYSNPNTLRDACEGADRIISALGVTLQKASPWDIDFLGNLRLFEEAEHYGLASFYYNNVLHCANGTSLTIRSTPAFSEALRGSRVTASSSTRLGTSPLSRTFC